MSDNHNAPGGSTLGAITTLSFWLLSQFALTDIAAFVAIVTGVTTIIVNVQRFYINKKKEK